MEFEVQKFTRRCATTERELAAGEVFYSVLIAQGADVVRRDYAEESWEGPPEESIGWWRSEVPDPQANRLHWAPNEVMLHYFQQLQSHDEKKAILYILTLLMIRRRIFKLEATESLPSDQEAMVVYCPKTEQEYQVPVCTPTEDQVVQIQQELAELLFAKGEQSDGSRGTK